MRTILLASLLAAVPLTAQGPDRLVLKSGRVLVGTVEHDGVTAVAFRDDEIGRVHVLRTEVRALEHVGEPANALSIDAPDDPGERPTTYIRWLPPTATTPGGLQTGSSRWLDPKTGTTVLLVGVVHIGDPAYYGELQKVLDASDLVLFEGVGRGDATDEQLAKLDVMMRMQLALKGALGLGFQKDHLDYRRSFWVNSDTDFADVTRALEERNASLPTDNPLVRTLLGTVLNATEGGGRRAPRFQDALKRQMGPILAQADEIMQRPGFAGMRGAIIEYRNEVVMKDLDRQLAAGPAGRRIAIFYGAGHFPDMEQRLLARGLEFQGTYWHTAWQVVGTKTRRGTPADRFDAIVEEVTAQHGDAGLETSVWIGSAADGATYTHDADTQRACASAIKTAYLVEFFAEYADRLDEPLAGLDAMLDQGDHPAFVHFDDAQRTEIRQALRGVSARRIGQMMIRGTGVSNLVYNAAANVVTASLGGPEALTTRLKQRFGNGVAIRRYMLAPRHVTGDNEASAAFLASVLRRIATDELGDVDPRTTTAIRDILFSHVDPVRGRNLAKDGALDTDPMTRIETGIYVAPTGAQWIYAVMSERADPGARDRATAYDALGRSNRELTARLVDALLGAGTPAAPRGRG